MCTPKPSRAVPALLAAALLAAAPALAAPSTGAPPSPGDLQLVADWWAGLTSPLVGLFAPARAEIDPDGGTATTPDGGAPTATSTDDPTSDPEHRHGVDPNG